MAMKKIYAIQRNSDLAIKIGVSENPIKRTKQLQCGSACKLNLTYESSPISNPYIIEAMIHNDLSGNISGEWFSCSLSEALICISEKMKFAEYKKENKTDPSVDELHLFCLINLNSDVLCGAGLFIAKNMNDANFAASKDFIIRMIMTVIRGNDSNFIRCDEVIKNLITRLKLNGLSFSCKNLINEAKELQLWLELA